MVAFYRDILGFQVADRGLLGPEGPEVVFMSGSSTDHHQIAFAKARGEEDASSLEHMAFRVDSIADVRTMFERVTKDDRVQGAAPITHGNAISVYFSDPEKNGIEIFCDSPFSVQQPQIRGWDPGSSDAEILAAVESGFREEPGFMPMDEYRAQKAQEFGENDA
jgi:catechol-2,3-dioxygenase